MQKDSWFLKISSQGKTGYGECSVLKGLSIDDRPDYTEKLRWLCENISIGFDDLYAQLQNFPSIRWGLEMAFKSLEANSPMELFPSAFTNADAQIPINGLVWMGSKSFMRQQIVEKLNAGFRCIKIKIGAIDFDEECDLLKFIRAEFNSGDVEIRVDANGAFKPYGALEKLKRLSEFNLHSIEQPISVSQWDQLASLCELSPIKIAVDEELIGLNPLNTKFLEVVKPDYFILKPSLIGGWRVAENWIHLAEELGIGWWATSALESNLGLNAIAQWVFTKSTSMPQGLGTGSLFTNNIDSPLEVSDGFLKYNINKKWNKIA